MRHDICLSRRLKSTKATESPIAEQIDLTGLWRNFDVNVTALFTYR